MVSAPSVKKVGIALESCGRIPIWCATALSEAVASNTIELVGFAKIDGSNPETLDLRAQSFSSFEHHPFSTTLTWAQKLISNRNKYLADAFDVLPFSQAFPSIQQYGDPTDLLSGSSVDILWWCAADEPPALLRHYLSGAALWYWQFDGVADGCGAAAGWFASMAGKPVAHSELIEFSSGQQKVIQQASNCVIPFSLSDNRSQVLWSAAQLSSAALDGAESDLGGKGPTLRSIEGSKSVRLILFLKLFLHKAFEKFKWHCFYSLFEDQWTLRYSLKNTPLPSLSTSLENGKFLVPPRDVFWADPHLIEAEGVHHVFFEEFDRHLDRGVIKHLSIDENGAPSKPRTVLAPNYHLSYPHVFKHEDETYMVPESEGERAIKLFRCHAFPDDWRFECNLISGVRAADSTLLYRDGKWWLFTTVSQFTGGSTAVHLYIYYSDDLKGRDWQPHKANPVVSDSQSARMAGAFIEQDGQLFRPAQNSAWRYGYGVKLFRVERLAETEYKETLVESYTPPSDHRIRGAHSYAQSGDLVVSDAELRRSRYKLLRFLDIQS